MIIAFTGKAGSGKDTAASMVNYIVNGLRYAAWLDDMEHGLFPSFEANYAPITLFETKGFADKVKDVASLLTGIPREDWDNRELRNKMLQIIYDNKQDYTYRTFLQRIGTEAMRDNIAEDVWVVALMQQYSALDPENSFTNLNLLDYSNCKWPNWVITDLRFENEAFAIKDRKGIIIALDRLKQDNLSHRSEEGIPINYINYFVGNNTTYEDLFNKLKVILNDRGITSKTV